MMDQTTQTGRVKRKRRMAREPLPQEACNADASAVQGLTERSSAEKPLTKAALVEALLATEGGASLNEICAATSWLPHTCRAFLTGLRKKGRQIERGQREDGTTMYRLLAGDNPAAGDQGLANVGATSETAAACAEDSADDDKTAGPETHAEEADA